ncbi:GSCOCG00004287001-RA-CDS [Cotesia congregata]|nr:GSCOCG00004287001-RA-CDS [Cotesia congregata]
MKAFNSSIFIVVIFVLLSSSKNVDAFNRECWRHVQSNFIKLRCSTDADCTYYTKCVDKKCENPCNSTCQTNEQVCVVRSHSASCKTLGDAGCRFKNAGILSSLRCPIGERPTYYEFRNYHHNTMRYFYFF